MSAVTGRYTGVGLLTMVLVFFLLPATAAALGFGALTLNSHLNEPLQAEVTLLVGQSEAIDQVRVELASEAEYRQMGLNRHPDLARVKVTRPTRQANRASVKLYSVGTIHAPMLSVVLKATKSGRGTYFRNYPLLFDAVETADLLQPRPQLIPLRSDAGMATVSPSTAADDENWARIMRYGPIRPGESLGRVAQRLRKDKRFSNNQVMLALYDDNRQAFVDSNINQLKEGAWLDVPASEVVRRHADSASMQRLSVLLRQTGEGVVSGSAQSPQTAAQPTVQQAVVTGAEQSADQALQYSGKISLNRASEQQDTGAAARDDALTSIHSELMAGKLQMSDLGKSVAGLNTSVELIQQDIRMLKHDVSAIRNRPQVVAAEPTAGWQVALYMLLAGMVGLLIGAVAMRKRASSAAMVASPPSIATSHAPHPEPVVVTEAVNKTTTLPTEKPGSGDDELIQLLNKVEERIGRCDYEEASRLLDVVDARAPVSLRGAALRAQLYHETDRGEQRDALINQISESSDKDGWQRFCQLLPTNVWNACFGEPVSTAHGADSGKG
ncbi:MAG: hypothetical protein COW18_10240 [Zetaproteobacteria bacterium CG12_big_fil_rev_8_21_14_0_65_54_13]|nr:MAG: hypothetical protein COX55_06710 [Zetaproteobacteria bacterium CG23_combo_of_CG06-09_8_20_14_all_54_7]PIW46780.1 MAG: hypothetical protein COW18_10240 [Zetaproteobacteria bacterium CG12_big_fil_rev_8_21_14_0_65_54_13]PIX54951.1 MAG: hypothetical protein COZ50_05280 [Zetaproteobacteria bacterium CG_4_10_14_3_um_filter_54_28]PJA27526.1 MAG: hypothetical protein CO188_12200 [Zetaproteobacteria bacterium CG_4_9_14_3_um_filter_54_145]